MVVPLEPDDPTTVGPFVVRGVLGSGGMGVVYLADGPHGPAAVKVIRAEFAMDPAFRARFRREVRTAATLAGVGTPAVLGSDADAEHPWLATAFVEGPTLAAAVAANGPYTGAQLRELGVGLAGVLVAVHRAGVVHRDIKPSNVLLTADGPVLIDFGIAHAAAATRITATGAVVGTPGYLPPELLADGTEPEAAGDVFALGATLAFAGTGRNPYGTGDPLTLLERALAGRPELDGIAGPTRRAIASCLAPDPTARPTAATLAQRLTARSPVRWYVLTTAAVVCAVVAAALWLTRPAPAPVVAAPAPPPATSANPVPNNRPVSRVVATVEAPPGTTIARAAVSGDTLYVARFDGTITAFDGTTGRQLATAAAGIDPADVVADAAGNVVLRDAADPEEVLRVDRSTLAEARRLPIGATISHLAITSGRLFVTTDDTLQLIDATTLTPLTPPVNTTRNKLVTSPDGNRIYTYGSGQQTVEVHDARSLAPITELALPKAPDALAAGNARVYATDFTDGTVTAVDAATGAIVYSTPAGDRPSALALSPGGRWLYVLVGGEDVLAVLDSATGSRVNAIPVGTLPRELLVGDGGQVYVTGPEPERVVILDR